MHYYKILKKRGLVILFLFIVLLLFTIASSASGDSTNISPTLTTNRYRISSSLNTTSNVMEVDDFYTKISSEDAVTNDIIILDGNVNSLMESPNDITAIRLPNQRIVLKYSEEDVSILPAGSSVTYYNDEPLIYVSDERPLLKVTSVVDLPIEQLVETATYHQSIKKLNTYKVKIEFSEFSDTDLKSYTHTYRINWGDGKSDEYFITEASPTHTYRQSGNYEVTIDIADDFGFVHSLTQEYDVEYEGHLTHTYFVLEDNKEPIAVSTSTGLSIFALGFIAFTETGKYKFLALLVLAIPLYTRIQKEDVLDQFVRGQIYGYIRTNPGVHYNQIRRGIDVKNGTLSYHLRVLEKTELVKSRREGFRYRAFYPTGMKFPKKERFRLTELQIQIIDVIKNNHGITQKDIAQKLNQKPQTINYNIKVLDQAGLITVIKKGRKTVCFLEEEEPLSDKPAQ